MGVTDNIIAVVGILVVLISAILSSVAVSRVGKDIEPETDPKISSARTYLLWATVILWIGLVIALLIVGYKIFTGTVAKVGAQIPIALRKAGESAPFGIGKATIGKLPAFETLADKATTSANKIATIVLSVFLLILGGVAGVLAYLAYNDIQNSIAANTEGETKSAGSYALAVALMMGFLFLLGLGLMVYAFVAMKTPEKLIEKEMAKMKLEQSSSTLSPLEQQMISEDQKKNF